MSEANRETTELIREWVKAADRLTRTKRERTSAKVALQNATNALGKQLDPGDLKDGEEIGIWTRLNDHKLGEAVLIVKRIREATYEIRIRERTKK